MIAVRCPCCWGKDAAKGVAGKGKTIAKAGADWVKTNPDKVDKAGRVGADLIDPNMPPETVEGQVVQAGKLIVKRIKHGLNNKNEKQNKKKQRIPSDIWGR